jgi:hypothetical protein
MESTDSARGRRVGDPAPGRPLALARRLAAGPGPTADLLRQLDDDPFGAADVAEPITAVVRSIGKSLRVTDNGDGTRTINLSTGNSCSTGRTARPQQRECFRQEGSRRRPPRLSCCLRVKGGAPGSGSRGSRIGRRAGDRCVHRARRRRAESGEAAEGIRTLDLLHGKQSLGSWSPRDFAANERHPRGDVRQGAGVGLSTAVVAARLPSRARASAERVPGSAV